MATLHNIDDALRDCIEQGFSVDPETGEVLWTRADLDRLEQAFSEKLEGCALWVKEQRALAKAIREEERALAARRKAIENRLDYMDGYILDALRSVDGGKFETPRAALSIRKSTRAVVDVPEVLPEGYRAIVTEVKPDKAAIAKALRRGEDVPGAHLETALNLRLK